MRNSGRIIFTALAAALHDPLPHHQAVFQRVLTSVRSLVYCSLVVQYRSHTTETLNYLADYLEEFHATEDIITTYRTSKATDSIAHARTRDLKMQLKAKHAIQEEERAERGEALSGAQMEHRNVEDKKHLQEVYNSMEHQRTSFDFVDIHLMLHYKESVQCFEHLVKDSTKTQDMNHPKMCMGPYRQSNCNFRYKLQILDDY